MKTRRTQIPAIPKFGEEQVGMMWLIQSVQNENRNRPELPPPLPTIQAAAHIPPTTIPEFC